MIDRKYKLKRTKIVATIGPASFSKNRISFPINVNAVDDWIPTITSSIVKLLSVNTGLSFKPVDVPIKYLNSGSL